MGKLTCEDGFHEWETKIEYMRVLISTNNTVDMPIARTVVCKYCGISKAAYDYEVLPTKKGTK